MPVCVCVCVGHSPTSGNSPNVESTRLAKMVTSVADKPQGFSLRTAAFLVVSSTVGGGILGTAGYVVIDTTGHSGAILVWTVGGIIAACGALTLAEVSASLPKSGGEFVILSEVYGPMVGFVGGWVSLIFGFIAPIAASGSAAAAYFLAPFEITSLVAIRCTATLAIVGFAVAHLVGRSGTERVQGIATASTILVLSLFILGGLWSGRTSLPTLNLGPDRWMWSGLFVGLIRVSYAYTGWNGASYVAGEIADAHKVLPRAILIGTAIVITLYLGIVIVIGLAIPYPELVSVHHADSKSLERVGDLAALHLFGSKGATIVSIAMGIVLLASLSAMILTGPRVAFAMAREQQLPQALGKLHSKRETPVVSTTFVALGAIVTLWSGSFEAITFAAGVGLSLNSLLTVFAVFLLRRKHPEWPRPFRTPGYPFVPLIFLGLTSTALVIAFLDPHEQTASLVGLLGVLSGVPIYWIMASKRGRA